MDKNSKEAAYASLGYSPEEIAECVRRDARIARMGGCKPGEYPWDQWMGRALAAGVPDRLAHLGRSLMREYFNHGWDETLETVCGYADDGAELLALALSQPARATRQWQRLLETDGLRGEWTRDGGWQAWDDVAYALALLDFLAPPPTDAAS